MIQGSYGHWWYVDRYGAPLVDQYARLGVTNVRLAVDWVHLEAVEGKRDFSRLDPIMADIINNLIVDCVKRLGATTISITHDMVSARKIADRIAMIHKGEIVWQGPARAVDTSGNPYVDQFIHGRAEGPIQMEILKA